MLLDPPWLIASIAGAGRRESWRRGGYRRLTHPNFCAIAFKRDFVHQLIDEVDSPTVLGMEVLSGQRAGNSARAESLSRITHHDHYVGRFGAGHAALHFFRGIIVAAVD